MMIDPILGLAFAIHSSRGVYALLIGSGVSRAAQIPTGWEVVLDLIEKLAHLQREDTRADPAAWYEAKYGEEPSYSKLLDGIAKSQQERQQLLASYFEPNEDERNEGLKLPTAAHRAIAKLVAGGFIRLIVTTNFDRLIEQAIQDEGITPTVISTPDAVEGALPLTHQRCCVLKLHGDYLDARIRNTPQELAKYNRRFIKLLDRVLDEFGMIVCGWSGQWDEALCAAFERCKSRRLTTYWAVRGKVGDRAKRMIELRSAVAIEIKDADSFLTEIAEKATSLDELQRPHPLSVAAATATIKRLLSDDRNEIRLHDSIQQETERTFCALQELLKSFSGRLTETTFANFLGGVAASIEVVGAMLRTMAYWGKETHRRFVAMSLERLAGEYESSPNEAIRAIPSLILLYQAGIAACAAHNIGMLVAMLTRPKFPHSNAEPEPLLTGIDWGRLYQYFQVLPAHRNNHFSVNEWLYSNCRSTLQPFIPNDREYDQQFDRFEFLRSLMYADLEKGGQWDVRSNDACHALGGRFISKTTYHLRISVPTICDQMQLDTELHGRLLQAGLFGGERPKLAAALRQVCAGVKVHSERLH